MKQLENEVDPNKPVQVMGHNILLSDIKNPHVRRAIRQRMRSFLFFKYGDHQDHTEEAKRYQQYSDSNHTDSGTKHCDGHEYEEYSESTKADGDTVGKWKKRKESYSVYTDHKDYYQDIGLERGHTDVSS